jgi:hypothetical protein
VRRPDGWAVTCPTSFPNRFNALRLQQQVPRKPLQLPSHPTSRPRHHIAHVPKLGQPGRASLSIPSTPTFIPNSYQKWLAAKVRADIPSRYLVASKANCDDRKDGWQDGGQGRLARQDKQVALRQSRPPGESPSRPAVTPPRAPGLRQLPKL